METHTIYGLNIACNFELPIPASTGEADITVHYTGYSPRLSSPPPAKDARLWSPSPNGWRLNYSDPWNDWVEFRLSADGTLLTIEGSSGLDVIQAIFLGSALGACLKYRGVPALHATALVRRGMGFLIAGKSGSGKSTLSAAMIKHGAALLSEDLTALHIGTEQVFAQSGCPRLRLYPDALTALGIECEAPRVFSPERPDNKHWIDPVNLLGGFQSSPVSLGVIYLLSERQQGVYEMTLEEMAPAKACLALLEHLYGAGWIDYSPTLAMTICAGISSRIPIRRLWLPDGLDTIENAASRLAYDIDRLPNQLRTKGFL